MGKRKKRKTGGGGSLSDVTNPFSTGAGGSNFETRVQAAFTVLLLTGRIAPCVRAWPITKLKLQGSYGGFKTDDFIVYTKDTDSAAESKLLAQIKHEITISESDETFRKVIASAWNDFNDPTLFTPGFDALALITGPLSARDISNTRTLLEWARHSETEIEFFDKVAARGFSSAAKKAKLQTFRSALAMANGDNAISDEQLWKFLKSYHLLGFDLDAGDGSALSLIQSLIAQASQEQPLALWSQIVDAIQSANQNAGTVTGETLPPEIKNAFESRRSNKLDLDLKRLREHGEYIIHGIKTSIGEVHLERPELLTELFDVSENPGFVFVTGERGFGKSRLARKFYEAVKGELPIFALRAEDLNQPHLDQVFSSIGLGTSLRDLQAGFALMPRKYLLIESIEKVLELQNSAAFTDLLKFSNTHSDWTVIATGRNYAHQQILFNYVQPAGVRYSTVTVSDFSDQEVSSLCNQLEGLREIAKIPSLKAL